MSGTSLSGVTQTDTTSGFVCAAPWVTIDKTLFVDVKASLASVRLNRNVLTTRVAAKSKNNVVLDQTFLLPKTNAGQAVTEHEYKAVADNQMIIVSANRPVHIVLTTANGVLDLGLNTIFILSSPIVSIKFANAENIGNAEINLIVV